jgi:hypothetical protein
VKEAGLGRLGDLFAALLLLDPGAVEAAAAAFVQNLAVNLRRVAASQRGLEGPEQERHFFFFQIFNFRFFFF